MSDEGILGQPVDGYASLPLLLQELDRDLSGIEWQLVIFVRPQWLWLESVYLQELQSGGTLTADEFWKRISMSPYIRWTNVVADASKVLGDERLIVRIARPEHDAVQDFFDICNLGRAPKPTGSEVRHNVSISAAQGLLLRELNLRSDLDQESRDTFRRFFQVALQSRSGIQHSSFEQGIQDSMRAHLIDDWAEFVSWSLARSNVMTGERINSIKWPDVMVDYVGHDFAAEAVREEILRIFSQCALAYGALKPRLFQRTRAKLRDNPRDAFAAVMRNMCDSRRLG